MEVPVCVVVAGNFTLASAKLGTTTVMAGRQIRQLEELPGTRLLRRNTRKYGLTEAGTLFYRSAKAILESVARAREAVQDINSEPRGRLRVDRFVPSPVPAHPVYLQDPCPRRRLASLVDFLMAELG